ncbi:MAG: hypothetical protein RR572_01720, partial [Raoultibacter sp.]
MADTKRLGVRPYRFLFALFVSFCIFRILITKSIKPIKHDSMEHSPTNNVKISIGFLLILRHHPPGADTANPSIIAQQKYSSVARAALLIKLSQHRIPPVVYAGRRGGHARGSAGKHHVLPVAWVISSG